MTTTYQRQIDDACSRMETALAEVHAAGDQLDRLLDAIGQGDDPYDANDALKALRRRLDYGPRMWLANAQCAGQA